MNAEYPTDREHGYTPCFAQLRKHSGVRMSGFMNKPHTAGNTKCQATQNNFNRKSVVHFSFSPFYVLRLPMCVTDSAPFSGFFSSRKAGPQTPSALSPRWAVLPAWRLPSPPERSLMRHVTNASSSRQLPVQSCSFPCLYFACLTLPQHFFLRSCRASWRHPSRRFSPESHWAWPDSETFPPALGAMKPGITPETHPQRSPQASSATSGASLQLLRLWLSWEFLPYTVYCILAQAT